MIDRAFFLGLVLLPSVSFAHHAVSGRYDPTQVIEIEGEVTDILWRNPHVQVTINVRNDSGEVEIWNVATTSLSNLRRWQISADFISTGDIIRVAGNPERRGGNGMYLSNVLTTSGEEVLLAPNIEPRWSDRTVQMADSRRAGIGHTSAPELGMFRVWSTPDTIPMLIPETVNANFDLSSYPLTDAATVAVAAYVRARDNPIANCQPKGMPTIMEAPYPWEFVRDGENMLWRQEEYDTVRTIHMNPDAAAEGQPATLLGYSIGHWEDENTLIVTTTNTTWRYFDTMGIPLSEDVEILERFTRREDGSRLDYVVTVTDPATFTEPVTLQKHWVWYADAEVATYDCFLAAED